MKKIISLIIICSGIAMVANTQQDPAAKKILDEVSKKHKDYTSIQADFELKIDNRRDDIKSSSSGKLIIKGDKYYMESPGNKVYYNGTNVWSYLEDVNEVSISEPDQNSTDFIENPLILFDFYKHNFKYKLVGEAKLDAGWMYEIDLFPSNLDQPYSRFKIFITRDTKNLYQVKAVGKDGVDYTAIIKNPRFNESIPDTQFTFDPSKYEDIEVVDLRF